LQNVVTYTVVLATANPEDILLPGMPALARISVLRGGKSLKVPQRVAVIAHYQQFGRKPRANFSPVSVFSLEPIHFPLVPCHCPSSAFVA